MQVAPPFGYKEVVPFLKTQKVRLLAPGEIPEFVQHGNALPISQSEFMLVARDYPIVFATGEGGKTFAPVAVLGMVAGENLFFAGGGWARGVYVPAYARRFPFCMARVRRDNVEQQNRLICIEKERLDAERGEAMFDAEGAPLDKWQQIERLLSEYEADLERSRAMCALLADYGLFEPFSLQATLSKGGTPLQMTGMHRVSEKRLENLNAAQLKRLISTRAMTGIYLHFISLENFARLAERKAARAATS